MNKGNTGKCLLEEDINGCVYFDKEHQDCKGNIRECGMYDKYAENPRNAYVRKPRWYEKYYKKNSFIR